MRSTQIWIWSNFFVFNGQNNVSNLFSLCNKRNLHYLGKKITPNWFSVNILHILLHALLHYFNRNFESIIVRKCSEKCAENVLLYSICRFVSSVFNFTRVLQVQSVFDNEGKLMWTSEGSYKLLKSEDRDKVKLISSPLHAGAAQRSPLQFMVMDGWRMWTWALSETRLIEFHTFQI